ncbi:MAG: thioesterase [Micromonosporaceae bacterium]
MTVTTPPRTTVVHGWPGYEGANIRTWIGFKHLIYLVEQALLRWLEDRGTNSRDLYLGHGLGFEIVDCSVQLPAVLELDDRVRAEVIGTGSELDVRLLAARDDHDVTVLRGKVTVALVRERTANEYRPAPDLLRALEVVDLADAAAPSQPAPVRLGTGDSVESVLGSGPGTFLWSWRAPYFYCHFSDRVQHSGFVRALEEVVDRFLVDRGISVGRLLNERSWIPVVSRCRVQLRAAAHMEEIIHTTFAVTGILRNLMFDAQMDCYVRRGTELVHVATARILHGYAIAAGPGAGRMVELDGEVWRALTGRAK